MRTRLWLLLSAGIEIASSAHMLLFENIAGWLATIGENDSRKKMPSYLLGIVHGTDGA